MKLLFQMWRAIREFQRLELEEKIKRDNIFQSRQRVPVWVPRSYLLATLHVKSFFNFIINNFFGIGKKEERLENIERSMYYIDEKAEGIIDNLIEAGFLDSDIRKWKPYPGQVVSITYDKNGEEVDPVYQEKLKITFKGRTFAESPIMFINYLREKIGLGWGTLFTFAVTIVLILIIIIGVLFGYIEVKEIFEIALEKFKNL